MLNALKAAIAYFGTVFAVGFLLGAAIRTIFVMPLIGEPAATIIELPVMILVSWFSCTLIVRRLAVGNGYGPRLFMGISAFAFLILAETFFGLFALDISLGDQWRRYQDTGPLLGLTAQLAFASFPLLQAYQVRR